MNYDAELSRKGSGTRIGTVAVSSRTRGILLCLSTSGFLACLLAYVYSFFGSSVDVVLRLGVVLGIGAAGLVTHIYIHENPAMRDPLGGITRNMPGWVALVAKCLALVAAAHLVWSIFRSGPGAPGVVNGQYALVNRGRVLKLLSQSEYTAFKQDELRVFATMLLSFYFVPMMYWSYRKPKTETR